MRNQGLERVCVCVCVCVCVLAIMLLLDMMHWVVILEALNGLNIT